LNPSPCPSNRGFSLMEAVFASFLLITSILISVLVFDSSLQAEANNEQRIMAAIVAESALEEVRSYANIDFPGTQDAYDGRKWTLPNYTQFKVEAQVGPQELAIPCTELETQYPDAPTFPTPERRSLSNSVWRCEVAVEWSRGSEKLRMVRYLANLSQVNNFEVVITPQGGSAIDAITSGTFNVQQNRTKDFKAEAFADGKRVDDVQFSWFVEPLDGFGSIYRVSRDGKDCRYKNSYRNYDGTTKHGPGFCDVVVRAVYQGVESKRKVRINNE
jgi:hypothetical protein